MQLSEGDVIKPFQNQETPIFPVIHRQYIYFFTSRENKEKFMKNPIKYICQPKPKPSVPVKIAIVGPPKSGKTTGRFQHFVKVFLMTEVVSAITTLVRSHKLVIHIAGLALISTVPRMLHFIFPVSHLPTLHCDA